MIQGQLAKWRQLLPAETMYMEPTSQEQLLLIAILHGSNSNRFTQLWECAAVMILAKITQNWADLYDWESDFVSFLWTEVCDAFRELG